MPLPPRAIASNACWPQANVRVNGDRPRDLQVRDERFFARVLFQLPLHTVGATVHARMPTRGSRATSSQTRCGHRRRGLPLR